MEMEIWKLILLLVIAITAYILATMMVAKDGKIDSTAIIGGIGMVLNAFLIAFWFTKLMEVLSR